MGEAPEKLVSWQRIAFLILVLFGWTGYRLSDDYQRAGGWEQSNVVPTAVTLCLGLLVAGGLFRHANRPEEKDEP